MTSWSTLIAAGLFTYVVAFVYSSFAEYYLHRDVMHERVRWFQYPYEAHAVTHHGLFKADASYHCTKTSIQNKIRMAWWNGFTITFVGMIPFYLIAVPWFVAGKHWIGAVICLTAFISGYSYYLTYEYLHWCMHLPKNRRLEKSRLFRRLNAHHLLHHRWPEYNLNVVLPLADWWHGTLLTKALRPFPQVRGPAVPDVQPA